jgi:hypothetical protein
VGVKKSLHERVGGFDETLREREDTDYCFRIQLQGVELQFVPDATIHIRYGDTAQALFHQARLWARYQVLLYKRYGAGVPLEKPWRSYLQTWRDLIACSRRAVRKETRPGWMKTLGTQVGLLEGAIRYRVPPVCEAYHAISASKAVAMASPALVEKLPNQGLGGSDLAAGNACHETESRQRGAKPSIDCAPQVAIRRDKSA